MMNLSAKYSRGPGPYLATYFDQSPRAHDYRLALPPIRGLGRNFPVTSVQFP